MSFKYHYCTQLSSKIIPVVHVSSQRIISKRYLKPSADGEGQSSQFVPETETVFILKNICLICCFNISGFSFLFLVIPMTFPLRKFFSIQYNSPLWGLLRHNLWEWGCPLRWETGPSGFCLSPP